MLRAEPLVHNDVEGSLGYVGYLTAANTKLLNAFWREGIVPVLHVWVSAPTANFINQRRPHGGRLRRISPGRSMIYLTDVEGVLDGDKILSGVASDGSQSCTEETVSGGMVLKLEAAKRALEGGVSGVHIVGGAIPDGLFERSALRNQERLLALTRFRARASFVNPSLSAFPRPFGGLMGRAKPFRVRAAVLKPLGKRAGFKHSSAPTASVMPSNPLPTYKRSPSFSHTVAVHLFSIQTARNISTSWRDRRERAWPRASSYR